MPAALSIVLAFLVILAGARLKTGLSVSILSGSLVLALLSGLSPADWLRAALDALTTTEAFVLCAIIAVILIFSSLYAASGQSVRCMRSMRGLIRSRALLLAFFPALIGLLPMPGGAIFSAPMVENAATELRIPPKDQALINYWFRHIWELAWPLYPGLILAASLAGMTVTGLVRIMWPGTLAAIVLGALFILRPALRGAPLLPPAPRNPENSRDWISALPLCIAIGGSMAGEWLAARFLPEQPMEYGVIAALVLASGASLLLTRASWRDVLREAGKDNTFTLLAVMASIFVFKEILHRGHVVDTLAQTMGGAGMTTLMTATLPFLVGFVSGSTVAFVGATFPLLLGLAAAGQLHSTRAVLSLGLYAGFAGIMASPLHTCYIMTCRYFHQDPARLLPRIAVPSLLFIPAGLMSWFFL